MLRAHFSAIYWGDGKHEEGAKPDLYYVSAGGYEPLQPYVNQFGPHAEYVGPRIMPIYQKVVKPEAGEAYVQVSQVALPDSSSFLLFMSGGREAGEVTFAALDISEKAIPSGSIAFLNLTDKPLAADIRGSQQRLEPRRMAIFQPKESEKPDLPLRIAVFDEEWKQAYATVTRVMPDRSYLMVFFLQGSRDGAYRLRIFRNLQQLRDMNISNGS